VRRRIEIFIHQLRVSNAARDADGGILDRDTKVICYDEAFAVAIGVRGSLASSGDPFLAESVARPRSF